MQRATIGSTRLFGNSATLLNIKPFSEVPGPRRLPFIGNLHLYKLGYFKLSEYHLVLEELYKKYGPVVRQDIGSDTVVHVFEPDDVKAVHNVTGKMPQVPPLQQAAQLYRQTKNLTLGLGNMNGEEWYRLRSAVQQMMMRPKEVQQYLPNIDSVAQALVAKIESSRNKNFEVPNLRTLVAKWNLESSGIVCFDKRLGCLDLKEQLAEDMIAANVRIFQLSADLKFSMGFHNYIKTPKWKQFVEAEDFFFGHASRIIDESILHVLELVKKQELKDGDYGFLAYLLSRQDLTNEDIRIITFSLFADGLSTTTPALLFNLYNLAKYSDIQDKLYKEISQALSADDLMTVDVLNSLTYLKAVVKETFRVLPGGTEVSRILPADLVLSNFRIPAGWAIQKQRLREALTQSAYRISPSVNSGKTHVDLNQFVNFGSSKYFIDPEEFKPERWLKDESNSINKQVSHAYLLTPFGHGTRMCAGRRFAEQDLYTSLTRILQKFRLELVEKKASMERSYSTLLFPKHPLRIRFVSRSSQQKTHSN